MTTEEQAETETTTEETVEIETTTEEKAEIGITQGEIAMKEITSKAITEMDIPLDKTPVETEVLGDKTVNLEANHLAR